MPNKPNSKTVLKYTKHSAVDHQRELQLVALAKEGDHSAQTDLLTMHEGMCRVLAHKASRGYPRADFDDLLQAAKLGLLRATRTFDPARGYTFMTYAVGWIRSYAQREAMRSRLVWIPHIVNPKLVQLARLAHNVYSLEYPYDDDGRQVLDLKSLLVDEVEPPRWEAEEIAQVLTALRYLDKRGQAIVLGVCAQGRTLDDLATEWGICRERCRQLKELALKKLYRACRQQRAEAKRSSA